MAPHSSTLAWKIPCTEEPGRLQSMGSLKVGHDWATSLLLFTFMQWRRKWQLTAQCSCLENPRDGGTWWAAIYGVAQSQIWLKRLSSSRGSAKAHQVKNPPIMQKTQETRVQPLSQEDLLKKGIATHSSILAWRIPMDRGAWWATVHGVTKSRTQLSG